MSKDAGQYYRPTLQTTFGKEGNCQAAVIATLYDVDIAEVPYFGEGEDWVGGLSAWFGAEFKEFLVPAKLADAGDHYLFNGSMVMAGINSPSPDVERHAVITKDGRIVFDPMIGEVDQRITKAMDITYLLPASVRFDKERRTE